MKKRTRPARLLKKASPDPLLTSSLHLESLTESVTGDRPAPRESTRATSLQEHEKTALLGEMPSSSSCSRYFSRHWSRAVKNTKQRTHPIRPMGSRDLLPNATMGQNLTLLNRLPRPAPRLHHLRVASPPKKASVQPGAEEEALKNCSGREKEKGGNERLGFFHSKSPSTSLT